MEMFVIWKSRYHSVSRMFRLIIVSHRTCNTPVRHIRQHWSDWNEPSHCNRCSLWSNLSPFFRTLQCSERWRVTLIFTLPNVLTYFNAILKFVYSLNRNIYRNFSEYFIGFLRTQPCRIQKILHRMFTEYSIKYSIKSI